MPTLIYTPGVRVYIKTEKHGTLDVSEDLTGGTMVRRTDGVSTFDFSLKNTRRKYDLVFTPNDTIVVMMKRLTWLRTFTGYLNTVPLRTAWPSDVNISASCSLKRLQYWPWDPYCNASVNMLAGTFNVKANDGGTVANMIMTVLENVVGWPRDKVHIGGIPQDWNAIIYKAAERVHAESADAQAAAQAYFNHLGVGAIINGAPFTAYKILTGQSTSSGSGSGGSGGGGVGSAPSGQVPTGTLPSGTYSGVHLDANQARTAEIIFNTGANWGATDNAIICAIMAAAQESSLGDHVTNPSDGSSSLGLYQMTADKGSAKHRLDPAWATEWFFAQYVALPNPGSMTRDAICQAIERSGYPGAYAKWETMAASVYALMQQKASTPSTSGGPSKPGQTSNAHFLDIATQLVSNNPHIRYQSPPPSGYISEQVPTGLDCSAFVNWVYQQATGHQFLPPADAQAGACRIISADKAMKIPGALVFQGGSMHDTGSAHHVEISLGDGKRTVGAHNPRDGVGVADWGPSIWAFGGLVPGIVYNTSAAGTTTQNAATAATVGGTRVWPVANHAVTTKFGATDPSRKMWSLGYHTGADFGAVSSGDQVVSSSDGKVIQAGWNTNEPAYGNSVTIVTGAVHVMYCHLSAVSVAVGDIIRAGDPIGQVGMTGNASGPHLHMEVRTSPFTFPAVATSKFPDNFLNPVTFIQNGVGVPATPPGSTGGGGGTATGGGGIVNAASTTPGNPDSNFPLAKYLPNYDPTDPLDQLFGDLQWNATPVDSVERTLANALTGALALSNDNSTVLLYLKNLFASTMKSFSSAPNGDLIGWFPDYYGIWGTSAILRIEQIELQDFNVNWTDDFFVTHQFVQRAYTVGLDPTTGLAESNFATDYAKVNTRGIANIDNPELLQSLFGVAPENAVDFARFVYRKFGARPDFQKAQGITSPQGEFFMAIYFFMLQWAYQYQAQVPVTWMPEAWPGMLIQVPDFNFQAYITSVTHTFSFGEGGSFTTQINITAPAYLPGNGKNSDHALVGLPLAGGYVKTLTNIGQPTSQPPATPGPGMGGWHDPTGELP